MATTYSVYRDGIKVLSNVKEKEAIVDGLMDGTSYSFEVSITVNGNEYDKSEKINVTTQEKPKPSISPAKYSLTDTEIKGTYFGDIAKARAYVNDVAQKFGGTFGQDGTFTYYIGSAVTKLTDTLVIVGYDAKDVELARSSVKVNIKPNAPIIDTFTEGMAYVRGKLTGGSAKVGLVKDGVTLRTAVVSDNIFSIYATDKNLKAGDKFTVTSLDGDVVLAKTESTVAAKPSQEETNA